jgi:hypothetical protein
MSNGRVANDPETENVTDMFGGSGPPLRKLKSRAFSL